MIQATSNPSSPSLAPEANERLAFLQALIRLGKEGEQAVQQHVAQELERLGCIVQHVTYQPRDLTLRDEFAAYPNLHDEERTAIIARLPGTGGGRSLMMFAHPDSEPSTDTTGWRHDPFAGSVEAGRVYGWGVADDLAGVATMVESVRSIVKSGVTLHGDVIVASTPSKRHARGMIAVMQNGGLSDAALYLHPAESGAGMREIKSFAGGQLLFTITVDGEQPPTTEPGHTAFAHLAVNPIEKAMSVCTALQALDAERAERVHHAALDTAIGRASNLLVSTIATSHQQRFNRVAQSCEIGCALSFPPGETLESVQAEVEACISQAAAADAFLAAHPPRIAWISGVSPAEVRTDDPLFEIANTVIHNVTGERAFANVLHTSSDIRVPNVQHGIPTIGLGPLCGDLSQNGKTDEWVDLADYLRCIDVVAGIISGWCA
ncbi:hypothetical protein CFR75_09350 [Komagataeibacter xylinus]|uniref:Peptidase M20 dimerisation domain-containing protein n=1 Tax=Komagataeibacter xylinus TaxID=28448 RepID=A0A318PHV1_KOMXY|nr:M20/M25/M40 family metallo-hydrolase [Komagataeibacter xylinus]PYD56737.1 hypothetical protein CFR75_09350 [Komagataeibacter xylinus]GBQ74077.1 acetylornithine deacetylase [Komagataeibacter xylinus NBRC 15237]